MKKYLSKISGPVMLGVGAILLISDLMGIEGIITFAIGIILIVEGIDRMQYDEVIQKTSGSERETIKKHRKI